jgi:hypothetical protein
MIGAVLNIQYQVSEHLPGKHNRLNRTGHAG